MALHEALLVGINSYALSPLSFASNDATALALCLADSDPRFECTMLLDNDATRREILRKIDALSNSTSQTKILFLAGHAGLHHSGPYFLPSEATSPDDGVFFRDISARLRAGVNKKPANVLIILDCCHAGGFEIDTNFSLDELRDALHKETNRPNFACILACSIGSSAREDSYLKHGILTFHLVEGLNGGATNDDGTITTESLYENISRKMEIYSQKPSYRADIQGRFILSRVKATNSTDAALATEFDLLNSLLTDTETRIAELKPPFVSRETYRASGWLEASKMARVIAERRRILRIKHEERINNSPDWETLNQNIDELLAEFAVGLGVGVRTEFGTVSKKLGEGGFGKVYQVQSSADDLLAMKVFHSAEISNLAKASRFRNGFRAMDRLQHPRIVSVKSFIESPLAFFMEFIEGPNLRAWNDLDAYTLHERLSIFAEIVMTVEYAHNSGVIHRDIKPENVIMRFNQLNSRWEPVLTDFDLAWFAGGTITKEGFGSPFYVAPEQMAYPGSDLAHGHAVDIYSLSMLALFMITNVDPVSITDSINLARTALFECMSAEAATSILSLIEQGSAKSHAARPQSVAKFRGVLLAAVSKLEMAADPDSTISSQDFWHALSAVVGDRLTLVNPNSVKVTSYSDRTSVTINITPRSVELLPQKTSGWTANGVSTSAARESLRRQVDRNIETYRSSSYNIWRRGGIDNSGRMTIEVTTDFLSRRIADSIGNLLQDIIATYEKF